MFLKKLFVNAKIDDLPVLLTGLMGINFKISKGKVYLVTYHWKGLFETKILIKVILA